MLRADEPARSIDGARAALQPMHRPASSAAASTPHLVYYGGPVLSNAKVQIVYWGDPGKVFGSGQLEQFYADVADSPYFDWLDEYDTPSQSIGRGSFLGSATASGAKIGAITDQDIQNQLTALIQQGGVSSADPANTVYMVHFPPGMSISQGGSTSCTQFCAYHGTFTLNGHDVFYGVIPDQGADGCETGCGSGDHLQNTTSTASHELIEAVTDPAVGLATSTAAPLAWYDTANGEIGDICVTGSSDTGLIGNWTVQKEWSNKNDACIVTAPPAASDFSLSIAPASRTIAPGSGTTFAVGTAIVSGSPGPIALAVSGLPPGVAGAFSPASVEAGASATLTVSASASAPAGTASFVVTGNSASTTHSVSGTLTVSVLRDLIVNGGFERHLAGWTRSGRVRSTTKAFHGGSRSAQVGSRHSFSGESALYQMVKVPASGATTLRLWHLRRCRSVDGGGELAGFIVDGSGAILQTLFDGCATDAAWAKVTADLSQFGGQTVAVYFLAYDPGFSQVAAWMYVDDVSVTNQ
ncbi:MAG: COG1470 family protein [Myxococcales bacterium]